jgi:hypothetical protein
MDPMARVNFGKIYTVEHNVKVYNFGEVHEEYVELLKHQWMSVFSCDARGSTAVDEEEDEEED